jgi:glycosyltransferase involved in cell wall biosynthesis
MKILFVAPFSPVPRVSDEHARILNLVRELVRWGHQVHYAILHAGDGPIDGFDDLRSELGGGGAHEIPVTPPRQPLVKRALRRSLRLVRHEGGYRLPLDHTYDRTSTGYLRALHERVVFGAVIVEFVFLSKAFEAFDPNVFRILDTLDVFGDRHRKFLRAGQRSTGFSTSPGEEATGLRRADIVLALHAYDEKRLRRRLDGDARVRTVGHFVDLSRRIEPTGAPRAGYFGRLDSADTAGLNYLLRQVLPKVREHQPDFRLLVAGPASDRVRATNGVEILSTTDCADLYARAPLALVPTLRSLGNTIGLLEAMATGVPSVSTEMGVKALSPSLRRGVRTVADNDANAFAAAILELIAEPARCRRMGADAYADAAAWNAEQRSTLRGVLQIVSQFHVGQQRSIHRSSF